MKRATFLALTVRAARSLALSGNTPHFPTAYNTVATVNHTETIETMRIETRQPLVDL